MATHKEETETDTHICKLSYTDGILTSIDTFEKEKGVKGHTFRFYSSGKLSELSTPVSKKQYNENGQVTYEEVTEEKNGRTLTKYVERLDKGVTVHYTKVDGALHGPCVHFRHNGDESRIQAMKMYMHGKLNGVELPPQFRNAELLNETSDFLVERVWNNGRLEKETWSLCKNARWKYMKEVGTKHPFNGLRVYFDHGLVIKKNLVNLAVPSDDDVRKLRHELCVRGGVPENDPYPSKPSGMNILNPNNPVDLADLLKSAKIGTAKAPMERIEEEEG